MTLGSEFTFHPSISKPAQKGPAMLAYQLKNGKEWTTQNVVTPDVAERIKALMESRGRKATYWRLIDPSKPASKPRIRKAAKPVESVESAEA